MTMEFIGMKKNRVAIYLFGLLLLLSLTACGPTETANQPEIETLPLEVSVNPQYIIAEGIVLPAKSASLSFINGGVVDEILAEEGDKVKEGDVIAVLSGSEQLNAAVASAEYAVMEAQQNLDNFLEEDALNRANLELTYSQAKVALEDAQDKMNNKEFEPASELTLNGLRADYVQALDFLNDAEEEFNNFFATVTGTPTNINLGTAKNALGFSGRFYADYVINEMFYFNLYSQFKYFHVWILFISHIALISP